MKKWIVTLLVVIAVCLCILVVAVLGFFYLKNTPVTISDPVVDVLSPTQQDDILTGQPVMLQARAKDPDGVTRIEFWLDQKLLTFEDSPWEEGITPLPLAYSFRENNVGVHEIIVRAFDVKGRQGQSSLSIIVSPGPDPSDPITYEIKEGDTLIGIAETHGLAEDDVISALPAGSTDLPPVGEEITLPPAPEADSGEPPAGENIEIPDEYIPSYLPRPLEVTPGWMTYLPGFLRPDITPVGFLAPASLEVDRPYDGVYCYISAGDSPVIRTPSTGSYEHLEGNFWNIAEWFSGESSLAFVSTSGELRLRINCMGYTYGTAGGDAYNLGILDMTRSPAEYTTGWLDEYASGPDGWFRLRFRAQPLDDGRGAGGTGFDYLYLDSSRYGVNEIPLVPNPHMILEFRIYDEGRHISPPALDGFLIYRNGTLWRTTGPMTERYVVWDNLWEAGSCLEQTEFYVIGYIGDPESPDATIISNPILVSGYCPAVYKLVTVRFNSILFDCIDVDYSDEPGLSVGGSCSTSPQDYGPGVYGGVNVNGVRTFDIFYPVYSSLFYSFPLHGSDYIPVRELLLSPEESLTISSTMWDYDIWSDSDPFCWDSIEYTPTDLSGMAGTTAHFDETFSDINWDTEPYDVYGGSCIISYDITVEEIAGPPPPSIFP